MAAFAAGCPESDEDFCTGCDPGEDIYFCDVPSSNNRICAPSDAAATAICGAHGVAGKSECEGTAADETGEDGEPYSGWDPDAYVYFDGTNNEYVVDRDLIDQLARDGRVLFEVDSARLVKDSSGYFYITGIAQDDLANQLGLKDGDMLKAVNGIDLDGEDAYAEAIVENADADEFTLLIVRGTSSVNIAIVVQ